MNFETFSYQTNFVFLLQKIYTPWHTNFFFKDFIYLFFRERGREEDTEGEKHQCAGERATSPCTPQTRDLAHDPGIPLVCRKNTQPTELCQLGLSY